MDRPLSNRKQLQATARITIRILLILVAIVAAFFLLRLVLRTKMDRTDFSTATVEIGHIENAITASGLVVPAFEEQINAPISTEIKNLLVTSGTQVEAGHLLMELDQEYIQLEYDQVVDQVELRKNKITRLGFEYEKNLKELKVENEIKALQLSSLEAQLKDIERLQKIGSATQEEIEKAKLNLEIAKLEKQKLENNLTFKEKTIESDQRNLELEVKIEEKKLKEFKSKLNQTDVKAPRPGVVTWINEAIGKKVAEGEALVRLANLQAFRVEASCSDRYANLVKVGMPVKVRITNTDLTGFITTILPAIENNTIRFDVALEDAAHKLLRPNLRVEVFIISARKDDVVRVRNGAAFTGAVEQPIFVVRGDQAERRMVRIGLTNVNYVEILDGTLKEGEEIIISDMRTYDHLETITLK